MSRLLISYHYFRRTNLDERLAELFGDEPPPLFADSGAYSAKTQGIDIDVGEYGEWLLRWQDLFDVYANLDVIGDASRSAAQSMKNQRILENMGLDPLPVFHAGEPWEALDVLVAGYPYIALGGLVGRGPKAIMPWLVRCFQRCASTGAAVHGFGLTNMTLSRTLPFYSLDSTTWNNGQRYGEIQLWDAQRRRFIKTYVANTTPGQRHQLVYKQADLLRAHDMNPAVLADPKFGRSVEGKTTEQNKRETLLLIGLNLRAWELYEQFLIERHDAVHKDRGQRGSIIYLAGMTLETYAAIIEARKEAIAA
jgi:hypothetical protein